jgi:hypothetical protein
MIIAVTGVQSVVLSIRADEAVGRQRIVTFS